MVFVKVRETYDLHTTKGKMTVIGIHTPKPGILKRNYPGLLMQCRAYRPVSCDVRIACASVLPLDPQGVGLAEGDVAPEDVFNPILYKAISNKGMSQLESRIQQLGYAPTGADVVGDSAIVEVDGTTNIADEFGVYYGLLSQTNTWKHAHPQAGLSMRGLKPLVNELVYNMGDTDGAVSPGFPADLEAEEVDHVGFSACTVNGGASRFPLQAVVGKSKPFPFLNCTSYSYNSSDSDSWARSGFPDSPANCAVDVPYLRTMCGVIIIPPSRLHEMFFRMVCEWTVEFSKIRPISELSTFTGLGLVGSNTHYQNYSYESTKEAITGDPSTMLDKDSCMVSSNADIEQVM